MQLTAMITGNGKQRPNGVVNKNGGKPCGNKAINYSGYCGWHGGALHPLDKSEPTLTREAMFKAGKLPVEDMDEEELARGQVRRADGTWTNYRTVPQAIFQNMITELFKRADQRLRENLLTAVDTMAEIASGSAYEPEVRIRAAQFIYERVRGKNPDVVIHTQDKPFEIMMTDLVMQGGSRAASRQARGIESAIDAEVIDDDDLAVVHSDIEPADPDLHSVEAEADWTEVELVPLQPEPVVYYGPAGAPIDTPPADPLLRAKWERDKQANEKQAEETVAELAARLKKLRDKSRAQRYASRAKGLTYVESHGYTWKNEEQWTPDPDDSGYEMAVNAITFIEPEVAKVPAHVKAADTRRIKRTRNG
jgi:hypothetical protein